MPSTVTKTIGSSGGRDYSTWASWIAGCPANLVTADQIWRGEGYNDSEFVVSATACTISGITTDATRYVVMTVASGQGALNNASVRTHALDYNASNGVAIRNTGTYTNPIVSCSVDYTQFVGLQIYNNTTGAGARYTLEIDAGSHVLVDSCILKSGTGGTLAAGGTTKNCLLINTRSNGRAVDEYVAGASCLECTLISTAGSSSGALAGVGTGAGCVITNCAIFGFAAVKDVTLPANLTADHTATDLAANNSGTHTNDFLNLTFASQFVSSSTDFRAVGTGSLNQGTYDGANTPNDISGQARNATTPYIGCWEVAAAATGGVFLPALNFGCDIEADETPQVLGVYVG